MSDTYTVTDAKVVKENVGQYGLNVIKATFSRDGKSAEAEFMQKPETPLPQDGAELLGEISKTEYGLKFRKTNTAYLSNGAGGGKSRDAEIALAVAVKSATALAQSFIESGQIKEESQAIATVASLTPKLLPIVTGKPAESEGKAPAPKSDDDIPF